MADENRTEQTPSVGEGTDYVPNWVVSPSPVAPPGVSSSASDEPAVDVTGKLPELKLEPEPAAAPEPKPAPAPEPSPQPAPAPTPEPQPEPAPAKPSRKERKAAKRAEKDAAKADKKAAKAEAKAQKKQGRIERLAHGISRFKPVTLLAIIMFIAYCVSQHTAFGPTGSYLGVLHGFLNNDTLFEAYAANIFFGCAAATPFAIMLRLFCERFFEKNGPKRHVLPWFAIIAAAACAVADHFLGTHSTLFMCIVMCVDLFSFFMCFWLLGTKENDRELFGWILKNAVFVLFWCALLTAGLCVCLFAFDTLVLGDSGQADQYFDVVAALVGIFGILLFCAKIPRKDDVLEAPKGYKAVMAWVLLPVFIVMLVVLYIYIIKIGIAHQMPSGQMNWFGSFALLGYLVLWLGLRMHTNTFVKRCVRWLWIALIPVVAVQAYGIWIRFEAYGLTTLRYLGMVCLALGIIGLIFAAFNVRSRTLFLLAALVSIVVMVTPANLFDVPNYDQDQRLTWSLQSANMLDADGRVIPVENPDSLDADTRDAIWSSWSYLAGAERLYFQPAMADTVQAQRGEDSARKVFGFGPSESQAEWVQEEDGVPEYSFKSFSLSGQTISLDGATQIYLPSDESNGTGWYWFDRETGFVLSERVLTHDVSIDIEGFLLDIAANPDDVGQLPLSQMRIDCGDGVAFVCTEVNVSLLDGGIEDASIEGFYLVGTTTGQTQPSTTTAPGTQSVPPAGQSATGTTQPGTTTGPQSTAPGTSDTTQPQSGPQSTAPGTSQSLVSVGLAA